MKNFRKTIIALATVAAMLVPSVAMAATITAEVDSSVAGNVYAGFYNGGVLQKAVLGGTTTAEAGAGSTDTETVTEPTVSAKIVTANEAKGLKKVVFSATTPADSLMEFFEVIFSYDKSVVVPATAAGEEADITANGGGYNDRFKVYANPYDNKYDYTIAGTLAEVQENRTGVKVTANTSGDYKLVSTGEATPLAEFYFKVKAGAELKADTFQIENNLTTGSLLDALGSPGVEVALQVGEYKYGSYLSNVAQTDTLKFAGFDIVEDVEPEGKPVVTVADEFVGVSEAGNVHKLVFSVKAPEDTSAVAATTLTFAYDKNDITPYDTDMNALLPESDLADYGCYAFKAAQDVYNSRGAQKPFKIADDGTGVTWNFGDTMFEATVNTAKDGADMPLTNTIMFTEFYYVVNDGAKVDENTFTFSGASFGDTTDVAFAGFPWKAAETTKTLTIENVDLTGVTYDEVRVFVWDDKQIAQCDSLAMTDGEVVVK